MSAIFWCSIFMLVYPLAVYPAILGVLSVIGIMAGGGKSRKKDGPAAHSVSMVLSVYNEAATIKEKISNFLALDYPADKLELIVVSDGSDDGTDELVAACACPRVKLLRQEGRLGKTSALNLAVASAKGDLLFFTDADSMLAADCMTRITAPFADAETGLVSGRSIYHDADGRENEGSLYRRYEEWQKEREGRLFGIAGADGAVYAMRRELYSPLPPEYINDLLHPVQTVLAGKKALTRPDAVVFEPGMNPEGGAEFIRQTRIMAQSWLIFLKMFPALARKRRWGYLWQLTSHKLLRWLSFVFILTAMLTAPALPLWLSGLFFAGLFIFAVAAILGARGSGGLPGRLVWLFSLQGLAALNGLYRLARGEQFVTWQPRGS